MVKICFKLELSSVWYGKINILKRELNITYYSLNIDLVCYLCYVSVFKHGIQLLDTET